MKKLICFILCILLLGTVCAPAVSAAEDRETEIFDDGSYLVITSGPFVDAEESFISFLSRIINWFKNIFRLLQGIQTAKETKYANYYSSDGRLLWSVHLTGEFTYNGKSSICTGSNITSKIYDPDWELLSSSHSERDNTATGSFVVKQYKLGVPLKEIERTLTLTCDKDGNIK